MSKKISIIIPTLNEEKILEETLVALRKFNGNYEIIVSDGRSTDKTVQIAKNMRIRSSFMKVLPVKRSQWDEILGRKKLRENIWYL